MKVVSGAAGSGTDVSSSNPMPVTAVNGGTFATQVDGAALTALQLIDDPVATLGTTTYTEAASKGSVVGAVRRDADTTLVDTTNEIAPLQVDARGALKVEAFSGETLPVSLASVPSHAVTNAGTFAVQVDGNALTALQLIDDSIATTGSAVTAKATLAAGTDGTNARALKTDSSGELQIDVLSIAAGNNNIGDVDVATLPVAFNTGTRSATTQRVTVATDDVVPVVGTVAQDAAIAGNPVNNGYRASAAEPTSMSADGDVVYGWADRKGRQVVAQKAATGTQSSVAGSASSVSILASNTSRLGATIFNDSTAVLYLKLGATASTTSFSYKMQPDSVVEVPYGYTGAIDGIWASATGNARITEIT